MGTPRVTTDIPYKMSVYKDGSIHFWKTTIADTSIRRYRKEVLGQVERCRECLSLVKVAPWDLARATERVLIAARTMKSLKITPTPRKVARAVGKDIQSIAREIRRLAWHGYLTLAKDGVDIELTNKPLKFRSNPENKDKARK